MMQGLITQLPQPYYQQIFEIWDELSSSLGVNKARGTTPIPHYTWHVAQSYSEDVMEALQDHLSNTPPPQVKTTGLGIFHNTAPVIFLSIQANMELLQFHKNILEKILPLAIGSVSFYEPISWTPHITLALGDTDADIAAEIIRRYATRPFNWEFPVDNIKLIGEASPGLYQELDSFSL